MVNIVMKREKLETFDAHLAAVAAEAEEVEALLKHAYENAVFELENATFHSVLIDGDRAAVAAAEAEMQSARLALKRARDTRNALTMALAIEESDKLSI